jgi:ABC-type cobalamin/Fe3+-siderophores transport system ATPase subunit
MKLKRFRVKKFRSVRDSGWIDADDVTALIGTNESGKTNLLIPLWKLNPAKNGEIKPLADYPRREYHEIRAQKSKPVFVEAEFWVPDDIAEELVKLTGTSKKDVSIALVTREFDGTRRIGFPAAAPQRTVATTEVKDILMKAKDEISAASSANVAEEEIKKNMVEAITSTLTSLDAAGDTLDQTGLAEAHSPDSHRHR